MSSPESASCAATATVAPCISPARAEASRRNGAKSRGPKTPEGKARSSQNALKHGLRAQKYVVLPSEDAAAFKALEAALLEELAPDGALECLLAQRIVAAAWRLERAEQIEAELFASEMHSLSGHGALGLALIRDCNGARAFDTLLRYRGGTLAEFWRALRTLKALQGEAAAHPEPHATPIEPERRANPGDGAPSRAATDPAPAPAARVPATMPCDRASAPRKLPDEPERHEQPAKAAAPLLPTAIAAPGGRTASLLAGTAPVSPGRRWS